MATLDLSRFDRRDAREIARAIRDEAERRGYVYPDDMIRLIDADLISIDEDGEPLGVQTAVAAIESGHPLLFGRPRSRSGGTPPARPMHPGAQTWSATVPWQVAATAPRRNPVDPATRDAMARSGRYSKM